MDHVEEATELGEFEDSDVEGITTWEFIKEHVGSGARHEVLNELLLHDGFSVFDREITEALVGFCFNFYTYPDKFLDAPNKRRSDERA